MSIYLRISAVALVLSVGFGVTLTAAHAWELDTLSDDSNEVSVSAQDGTAFETQFNSDGTKMFVLGYDNDTVYQYTLSSGWDLSTATYDTVSFSVNAQESVPEGMFFKPDGTEMYIIGVSGDDVNQYTLSSAWDLSTASYTGVSVSNSGNDPTSVKVHFNGDGTRMFITGFVNGTIYQYTLSSAWDVTTASYDSVSFSMLAQTSNTYATTFNDTGTRLYGVGPSDVLYQYDLSSAWDITTAAYASKSYSFNSKDSNAYGVTLTADGSKLFLTGATNDKVYRYSANPGDITSPSLVAITPVDNAIGISTDADLVIEFDEAVNIESGDVTIKETVGDATVEAIDVTGGQVTGDGTDTITVNPSVELNADTEYYVQIDATAFDDAASNSFAGIADTTSWSFTTERASSTGRARHYVRNYSALPAEVEPVEPCGEDGATFTLNLTAVNAAYYMLSTDHTFEDVDWEDFPGQTATVEWTLPEGQLEEVVYYRFRSGIGNDTAAESVSLVVDEALCDIEEPEAGEGQELSDIEDIQAVLRIGISPFDGSEEEIMPVEELDLIMGDNYSTVYLYEDGVRRPFINEPIYFTWYGQDEDIRTVTDATLASIPLGKPMLPKPGVNLVKIVSLPTVYMIEENGLHGKLVPLEDEAEAAELFGADWADLVMDLDTLLFARFEK